MPELMRMPEVAAGATHAVLSHWPQPANEAYSVATVIAIIETDKAVVDVESESDGVILRMLVEEGAEVAIGDPIALIAAPDEVVGDVDAALAILTGSAPTPAAAAPAAAESVAAATVSETAVAEPNASTARIFASPLARRLAKERGLDLSSLHGTGPGGRIRRRDVEQAQPAAVVAAPAPVFPVAGKLAIPAASGGFVDVPHSRPRRAIAARLTQSTQEAPHFYLRGSARVDRLLDLRAELNSGDDVRVSVNDLVVKAVARAHMRVPAVNVIWMDDAVRVFESVDIAVAVSTEQGLVTPVLRAVESMSISQVALATKDFAARARSGSLRQHELEGGSTSVTNLGMLGTEDFAGIINPPHSSILAVGAASQVPVVVDGALAIGTVMRVTLSVDHRPIDGATAAQWMRELISLLEQPARILA